MSKSIITLLISIFIWNLAFSQEEIMPRVDFPFVESCNHTEDLQLAITAAAGNHILVFPAGDYYIDAVENLNIPSNSTLEWEEGAIFYCIKNASPTYRVINIEGDNVTLLNPTIVGDRSVHIPSPNLPTDESGHGIVISGAENVEIISAKIYDCWGDGLVIRRSENVKILDLIADNNRRQGLTITSGRNILVLNPLCTNTNGTAPAAGIDIEPNNINDYLENISIIKPRTRNNEGVGIAVGCKKLLTVCEDGCPETADKVVSVEIINHYDVGSAHGFSVASLDNNSNGTITGSFRNIGSTYTNNRQNGVIIRGYSSENSPEVIIEDVMIFNPANADSYTVADPCIYHESDLDCEYSDLIANPVEEESEISLEPGASHRSPRWNSGISIIRQPNDVINDGQKMGNIKIIHPSITCDNEKMLRGIYLFDDQAGTESIEIINPLEITGVADRERVDPNADGVTIIDENNVCNFLYHSNINLLSRLYTNVSNIGSPYHVTWNLKKIDNIIDAPMTFENQTVHGERLLVRVGSQTTNVIDLLGEEHENVSCIETFEVGATMTLRRTAKPTLDDPDAVNTWTIEAMTGEWTFCEPDCAKKGSNEIIENKGVNLYPNPNDGHFTLEIDQEYLDLNQIESIEIVDVLGQLIKSEKVSGTQHEIILKGAAKGIYYMTLRNNQSIVSTNKFVIK